MVDVIKTLANMVNYFHDFLLKVNRFLGIDLNDKDLHFWIFGLIGFIIFIWVDIVFKKLAQWNISIISFIYTFTLMAIIALALEIMQKITGRGNMEFLDFLYGVWGFMVLAGISLVIKLSIAAFKKSKRIK